MSENVIATIKVGDNTFSLNWAQGVGAELYEVASDELLLEFETRSTHTLVRNQHGVLGYIENNGNEFVYTVRPNMSRIFTGSADLEGAEVFVSKHYVASYNPALSAANAPA